MTDWREARWHRIGLQNGHSDTLRGVKLRVVAEGGCAAYATGYALGVAQATKELSKERGA